LLVTFVAPVAVVMVTLAPALIHVLYGAHWVPAAAALRFLAFVMVARMFTALVFDIQTGLGNTQVTVWLNLAWLAALLPALWIGVQAGGIQGAAMGHATVALVVAIPLAGWMLHRSGVDMRPVLRRTARPLLAGVVAALAMAAVALPIGAPLAQLVLAGGLGVAVYLLIALPLSGWAAYRRWVSSYLTARREARA
jgi:PST family polysaccharide transporter